MLIALMTIFSFTACGKENDGTGYLFRYDLSSDPQNLDPQVAVDTSSLIVIRNIYSGLFTLSETGAIENSLALDYTISDDGLIYDISIRDDNYWANADSKKEQIRVTAKDFEYAFKRIFNPQTSSPYKEKFICIKNAEKIINGEIDYSELGVTATSDFSLRIELEYSDADFLSLLTTTPAMPCNSSLFHSTNGKYGLDPDNTYTNGPFYVKQWEFDPYGKNNHMILRKNKMFSEEMDISPSSLNFFIEKEYSDRIADFEKEDIDCIITDGSDDFIDDEDYSYTEYKYKTYGIMVNTDNSYFSQVEAREAISLSIDRGIYKEELTKGRTSAYAIIPPAINILNKSYRNLISDQAKVTYNPSLAREKWDEFLLNNDMSSLTGVNIIVKEGTKNSDDLNRITSQWQQNIGFFCGIEVLPEKEYNRRIEENEYLLALTDVTADNNSPRDVLSQFVTGDEDNTFSYSNDKFDEIFDKAIHSKKLSDSVQFYSDAESAIIDDYSFIPVFYESEYLIYPKEIQGIGYNPFTKELDFIHAKNFD